jgi:hypothetical protein
MRQSSSRRQSAKRSGKTGETGGRARRGIADCGLQIADWSLNSKSQAPNYKQAPISNAPNSKQFSLESKDLKHAKQRFEHWILGFRIYLGFVICSLVLTTAERSEREGHDIEGK